MKYPFMRSVPGAVVALCAQLSICAQPKLDVPGSAAAVSVPFVGCRTDTQSDRLEAPKRTVVSLPIDPTAVQALAYYGSDLDGVLAPKGWYCLGQLGSGGSFLFVSSRPIDAQVAFAPQYRGFAGSVIEISNRRSDQHGDQLDKAQIVARAFPANKELLKEMAAGFDFPASSYPFGPHRSDKLTNKSKTVVEYITRAQEEGLGTHSSLKRNGSPIQGVVILRGDPPDVIHLAVRLPHEAIRLTPVIVAQFELEYSCRAR